MAQSQYGGSDFSGKATDLKDQATDQIKKVAGQVEGGPRQGPQLSLVVRDPARIEPAVPERRRERLALPELDRRRRLDVEMAVTEDERSLRAAARADERVDDRPSRALDELGVRAACAKQGYEPLRRGANVGTMGGVCADARDAQKLTEFGELQVCNNSVFHVRACFQWI